MNRIIVRDDSKIQDLIADFIRLYKLCEMDAMKGSTLMRERWGLSIDWHEFAYVLDAMERRGEVRRSTIQSREMTRYIVL